MTALRKEKVNMLKKPINSANIIEFHVNADIAPSHVWKRFFPVPQRVAEPQVMDFFHHIHLISRGGRNQ